MIYDDVRAQILPGDVIAFGGDGMLSWAIRKLTSCPVSHVGIVHHVASDEQEPPRVMVIEVTSLQGKAVVQTNPLSFHVQNYRGRVWWLPLADEARARTDLEQLQAWGTAQLGKVYDLAQAIGGAVDWLPDVREDFSMLYCSELVAGMLEVAGVVGPINASEQTPRDVVELGVYAAVVQLRGEPMALRG